MERVLHRVQVIQVAPELIEPVQCRQELIEVAKMVLAELSSGIAQALESRSDGWRLRGHAYCSTRLPNGRKAGANWQLAGDEVGASCCATRFGVIVGEAHSFAG